MCSHYGVHNIPPLDLILPHPAHCLFDVYFTSTPRFSKWSLIVIFFKEIFILVFHSCHAYYLSYPPQPHGFYYRSNF